MSVTTLILIYVLGAIIILLSALRWESNKGYLNLADFVAALSVSLTSWVGLMAGLFVYLVFKVDWQIVIWRKK